MDAVTIKKPAIVCEARGILLIVDIILILTMLYLNLYQKSTL